MNRSTLEVYVDVLQTLAQRGPLKLSDVMYEANLNSSVVKGHLDFLIQKGLAEERIAGKRSVVYAVTQNGVNVVKYFRESKKALPIVEETRNGASKPF
jgi:predicted transcriptional regulator